MQSHSHFSNAEFKTNTLLRNKLGIRNNNNKIQQLGIQVWDRDKTDVDVAEEKAHDLFGLGGQCVSDAG